MRWSEQRTAPPSTFEMTSTLHPRARRAPLSAVAHLIFVRSMRHALVFLLALCAVTTAKQAEAINELDAYIRGQETGICHIHHTRMVRYIVNESYGLRMYEGPFTAASRHFLNWSTNVNGGCMVPKKPAKAAINVCPECKRLARRWALKHSKDAMAQQILDETRI